MESINSIRVQRLSQEAILPTRAHSDDAGLDIYCLEDITLEPKSGRAIRSGIALALPPKHVGLVADRSSLAKKGVKCAGGVIDAGYRGEIHVVLWNISGEPVFIRRGDRMAQILILPIATPAVMEVTELDETTRGTKGFGSTGA